MTNELSLFVATLATLVVIVDPFGNLPVFMSLTGHFERSARHRVAWQANALALVILLVFGFFGYQLFGLLDITPAALQISGGLLLLIIALQLLTGAESDPGQAGGTLNVAAVPLGTPLLAGPGAIVALMVQMDRTGYRPLAMTAVALGAVVVMLFSWLTMYFADPIMHKLGASGVAILTRLSGMMLAAIAVQLMITGILAVVQNALN